MSFWLDKVVRLGEGDHLGQYELWWYTAVREFGTYHPWIGLRRKPMVDWQLQSSIQYSDKMVGDGKHISAKSEALIRSFMQRWTQECVGDVLVLEPDELPADDEMDLD